MIELSQVKTSRNKSVDGELTDGRYVEFKANASRDIGKFVPLMVAMANERGGFIIFGVIDRTKEIVGIKDNPKLPHLVMRQIKFSGTSTSTKDMEIMSFLHERVFDPILNGSYDNKLKQGVRITIMRMDKLPTASKVQYFWSAIVGTDRSIHFADEMLDAGAAHFEDVINEFRTRFDDNWLRH